MIDYIVKWISQNLTLEWWMTGIIWLIIGVVLGTKILPRLKRVKLPKGSKRFLPEKKYITEIGPLQIGDGKPTYWREGSPDIKDPEIVPEGITYFTVGVYDGRGFCGGKHHKIWVENRKRVLRLQNRLKKRFEKGGSQ